MADLELQSAEQQQLIEHLKVMIREREESLQTKEAQLKESNAKVAKLKLQTKAKDTKLRQLEGKGATSDAALTDKSDPEEVSRLERGHAKLFKKRVEEKEKIIIEKDEIIKIRESQIEAKERVLAERETMMLDLRAQLQQKTEAMEVLQSSSHGESGLDEMYAQIVYKDKKLLELNNKILEQDRQVMDLQEYVSEKNEVIRGRDKVIEILQSSLKDKDQNVQDQAMLIAKLTSKVEKSEEQISLLNEELQKKEHDLKIETDRFSLKLSESQKYFEETLSEREAELKKLHENISIKDREVLTSQNDLREIINRHERDIQSIMSKSSLNIEDTVIKMMEQKIKDSNEVLEGKIKVVEIMQSEMTRKDEELSKNREALRTLKDKLQVTSEQLMLIQSNFVDMEEQWKDEKCKLETKVKKLVEKHETEVSEKDLQMQSLQISLTQYENVYVQASVQYSALQERYQQTFSELQKLKEGDHPQVQTLQSSSASDFEELKTINESLKAEITQKNEQLEKSETKMLKMKAQMTAKIKNLEKELEGLRQGSNLADEVMTLKNKLLEMEEEKGNLQLKLIDLDEQKSVQAQLEVKLGQLEEEKEKLSCEIRELQSNLHVTNDEREKLSQIVTDLQCSVDENQVQHDITQSGLITSLQSEVEEIRVKKDQLEKDVEEGRCKFIKLEEEKKAYQENKLQRETDIEIMQGRIIELETKLSSLDSSDSEMKNKISSLETEKVSLEMKMVEFEKQREGSEEDKARLYSEINSLNENIENEKQAKIVFEKENEELQTKIQQLEKSLEHSETELTSLKQENSELISKLDNLEKEKFESTRNVENNSQELQEANQTKVLLEQQLQTSKQKIEKLEETLKTTVITLEETTRNLSESAEKLSSSEHKVVNLEQELSTHLEKYQAELQDLRGRNEVLEGDVHFHQNGSEEKSNTIMALKTQINDKDNEIRNLQSLVREKSDKYAELELHVKKVTRELEIAKEGQSMKGVEFEKKSQSLLYQISDLESEILEHKKTSTELQDTILKLQYELDSSKSELSAITNLLSEKNDEITSLGSQLKELALSEKSVLDELESEKNSVQALQTENSSLKSSIEKLNSDLSEISILKDNLQIRCQELSKELVVKEDIIASLRTEVNSGCDIRQEQAHELQSLRAQIVEFQNDIERKDSEFVIISDKYKSENNELVSQIETLRAEKTELLSKSKSEVEHLQKTLSNKEQTLSELNLSMESDTSTTKLLLEEKDMQIQKLENDIELLIKEKHSLVETVQTLESSLSTMKSDVNVKSNLCMEKDSQIQVLNAEIQDAILKILSLESTVQKSFSEKVTFENQVVKLQKELAEHSYQVRQLTETNTLLLQQCESSKCCIIEVETKLNEVRNENNSLKEKFFTIETICSNQNEQLGANQSILANLNNQLQLSAKEKNYLEQKIKISASEIQKLKEDLSFKVEESEKYQNNLKAFEIDNSVQKYLCEKYEIDIGRLKEENQCLQNKLSVTNNKISQLNFEFKQKHENLSSLSSQLQIMTSSIQQLETKVVSKDTEIQQLQTTVESKTTEIQQLQTEVVSRDSEIQQLQTTVESKDSEIQQIQRTVESKDSEIQQLQTTVESKTIGIQQLQTTVESKDSEVQQLQTTVVSKDTEIQQLQTTVVSKDSEIQQLQTAVESKDSEIQQLQTTVESKDPEIQQLQTIVESKDSEIQQLQTTVESKDSEIQQLQTTVESKDSGIQQLQTRVGSKDSEIQQLQTAVESKDSEIQQLQTTVESKDSEIQHLQTAVESKDSEIQQLQTTVESKDSEIQQLQTTVETKTIEIQQLQTTVESKDPEIQQLQTTVESKDSEIQQLQTTVESKTIEIQQLQTTVESKDSEIQKLQTTVESKTIEIQQLQTTVDSKTTEIQQLQTTVESKTTEIHQLQTKVVSKDSDIKQLEIIVESKDSEIQQLQTTVESQTTEIQQLQTKVESNYTGLQQLQTQVKSKDTEVNLLLKEVETKDTQIQQLQTQVKSKDTKLQQLQKKIEIKDNEIEQLQTKVESKATEIQQDAKLKQFQAHMEAQYIEIRQLQKEVESKDTETQQLQKQVKSKDKELQQIQSQMECKDKEIQKEQNQVESKDAELHQLQIKVESKDLEIQQLQTKVETEDTQFQQLQTQCESKVTQIQQLQALLNKEREVILINNDQLTILSTEVDSLSNQLELASSSYQSSISCMTKQLKNLQKLQTQNEYKDSGIKQLQKIVESKDTELQKLQTQVECKEVVIQQLQAHVRSKDTNLQLLQKQVETKDSDIIQLHAHIESKDIKLQQLLTQVESQDMEKQELHTHLRSKGTELQQLQAHVESKDIKLQQLQKQVESKDSQIQQLQTQVKSKVTKLEQLQTKVDLLQQLQAQVESKDTKLQQLQAQVESKDTKLQQLQAQFEFQNIEIQQLHIEVESKDTETKQLQTHVKSKDKELKLLHTKVESKDTEIQQLQKKVEFEDTKLKQLQITVESKDSELQHIQTHVESKATEIQQLQKKFESEDLKLRQLHIKVESKDTEIQQLKRKIETKDTMLQQLQEVIFINNDQLTILSTEVDQLELASSSSQSSLSMISKQMKNLQKEATKTRTKLEYTEKLYNDLKLEYSSSSTESLKQIEDHGEKLRRKEEMLTIRDSEINQLQIKVDNCKESLSQLLSENTFIKEMNTSLNEDYKNLKTTTKTIIDDLQLETSNFKHMIESLQKNIDFKDLEINDLTESLSISQQTIRDLEKQQNENDQSQIELHKLFHKAEAEIDIFKTEISSLKESIHNQSLLHSKLESTKEHCEEEIKSLNLQLNHKISDSKKNIAKLNQNLREKEDELTDANTKLDNCKKEIENLSNILSTTQKDLLEQNTLNKKKSNDIEELTFILAEKSKQCDELNNDLSRNQSALEKTLTELLESHNALSMNKSHINEQDTIINELRDSLQSQRTYAEEMAEELKVVTKSSNCLVQENVRLDNYVKSLELDLAASKNDLTFTMTRLETLESEESALKRLIEETKVMVKEKEDVINELNKQIEKLNHGFNNEKIKSDILSSECTEIIHKNTQLTNLAFKMDLDRQKMNIELNHKKLKICQTADDAEKVKSDLHELTKKFETKLYLLDQSHSQKQKLERELYEAQQSVIEIKAIHQQCVDCNLELEKQLEIQNSDMKELKQCLSETDKHLRKMQEERLAQSKDTKELQNSISVHKQQLETMKTEMQKATNYTLEKVQFIESLESEKETLNKSLQEINYDVKRLTAEASKSRFQIIVLEEDKVQLSNQLVKLQEEVVCIESGLKDSKDVCCELQKKQEQYLKTIQILTDSEHSMRLCLDEKQQYTVQLEKKISAVENDLMEVQQKNQIHWSEKQQEYEKLLSSLYEEHSETSHLQASNEILLRKTEEYHLQIEMLSVQLEILKEELLVNQSKLSYSQTSSLNLTKQLNSSISEKLEKEDTILQLTNELEMIEETCEELNLELNSSRAELSNILEEKDRLQQEAITLVKTVKNLETISSLKSEFEEKYLSTQASYREILQKSEKQDEVISCKMQTIEELEAKMMETSEIVKQISIEKEELVSKLNQAVESKTIETSTKENLLIKIVELEEQLKTMEDIIIKDKMVKENITLKMQLVEENLQKAASHDEKRILEIEKLNIDLQDMASKKTSLLEENQSLVGKCDALQTEIQILTSDKQALLETSEGIQREFDLAQKRILQIEWEKDSCVATLKKSAEEKDMEAVKCKEVIQNLSEQLEVKKKTIAEKEIILLNTSSQLLESKSSIKKLVNEREKAVDDLNLAHKLEMKELSQIFEDKIIQNDILVAQIERLSEDMASLKAKTSVTFRFKNLYESQSHTLKTYQEKVKELQNHLLTKATELEELQNFVVDIRSKLSIVEDEMGVMRNSNEELNRLVLNLNELNLKQESQIQVLSVELNDNRLKEQSLCAAVSKVIKEHLLQKAVLAETKQNQTFIVKDNNDLNLKYDALKSDYDNCLTQLNEFRGKYETSQQLIKDQESGLDIFQRNISSLTESKTNLESHPKEMELEKDQIMVELENAKTHIQNHDELLLNGVKDTKYQESISCLHQTVADKDCEIMFLTKSVKEREDSVPKQVQTSLDEESQSHNPLNASISTDDYTSLLEKRKLLELQIAKYLQMQEEQPMASKEKEGLSKTSKAERSEPDEVSKLKKVLKKKEARIATLNKQLTEHLSMKTPTSTSGKVAVSSPNTQLLLDEANAKLFLDQERRCILEKQLNELTTERADIVVQLDQIPLLKSSIVEKEVALNELRKLNAQVVLHNKELMKRLNMEQKTAETDLEFSRHLQTKLQSQNVKLCEQMDSIEAVEEQHKKRECQLLDAIQLKENEIDLLKHDAKKMTEAVIETETLMKSVQSEILHYKEQMSNLKQEIINMGDTYVEELNKVNGDIFEFMKLNIKNPSIVINKVDPERQDYMKLTQDLKHMNSDNQALNEKVQKLEIQLQYEKDLAQSMAIRYQEEVKEISELRSQVHKLKTEKSSSQNDDKEDDDNSTISSNGSEQVENYERAEIARLTEKLHQDDNELKYLIDQKKDLEMELSDLLDELQRKNDMLFQTKDELNSSLNFIDELESDLRDRDDEIRLIKDMLEKAHTDVLHLRDELNYKDGIIGTLSPKTPSSRTQSFECLDEVTSYQKTIKKKEAKILVLSKKIQQLTDKNQKSAENPNEYGKDVNEQIAMLLTEREKFESCIKARESKIHDLEALIASSKSSEMGDANLKKLLKKKEAKILVLNKKLAELTKFSQSSANTSIHSDLSVSQESLDTCDSLRNMFTADIHQKDLHIQDLMKSIADLQTNLSYYKNASIEKDAELDQAHAELTDAKRTQSTLTSDQEKMQRILLQKEEELELLNQKWKNAKQNLEESYSEQDINYNHCQLLESQKAELELQIAEMKKHHSEMSTYSEGLWNELGELKLNYETLLSEKEDLELQIQQLTKEKEEIEVKMLELQNEVQDLRTEKEKLDSDFAIMQEEFNIKVKDDQTKESHIIKLTHTNQEVEKERTSLKQCISEKNTIIEELIEKLNVDQEQKSAEENLDKNVIKHLEEEIQNNLSKIEDLSETCQIQKANLEVTRQMLKERDILIEQLQQKSFDTECVADLQASLTLKESKISELFTEVEYLNKNLMDFNEAKDLNLTLKKENEELSQHNKKLQNNFIELEHNRDDVQQQLDKVNALLLERDWVVHDLRKQVQQLQSELTKLSEGMMKKEESNEDFKILISSLKKDLHALDQVKDQQFSTFSDQISYLKQDLKSCQVREELASSSMKMKDQDIAELEGKFKSLHEHSSKIDEELNNLYLKEKDYIEKCKQQSEVINDFQRKLSSVESDCDLKELKITELMDEVDKLKKNTKGRIDATLPDLAKLQTNLTKKDAKVLSLTKKLQETHDHLVQKTRELDDMKNASGEKKFVEEVNSQDYFSKTVILEEVMVKSENISETASMPHQDSTIQGSPQIFTLTTHLNQTKKELAKKEECLKIMSQMKEGVDSELITKDKEIESLKSQIIVVRNDYEIQLAELSHKLSTYTKAANSTTEKLASLNQVVCDLQSQIDSYKSALSEKDIQISQSSTALQQRDLNNQQLRDTMLEMNNKIQNYAETVSKLQCQLDSQDENVEASVNHNEKFQILTSQLQEAIDMKSEIEVRYNQVKEEFTEMADQFSRQLQGKADEMVNLQSELEKTRKEVQMSNNLLQEKDVKINSLVENIQEMDLRLSQLTENETLTQELEKAKVEIEEKQQVLDDKVLTLKKALATVKKLKFQLEKSDEKMKVLENGREEEQKKYEELYKELQEKNFEVKELKSSMQSLKTDVITADTKELDEIKSQMQSYVEYSQQLQEQVQQLSETVFKSEKQLKQKQAALDDMEEESSKLKTETIELKIANDCLKQEIEKITQINEDHKHTVLLKEKHMLKLSRQIEDLDSGYLILQQQLTEKDDEISSLMTENTRLNVLESSFEDKLEELSKFHSILRDLHLTSPDQLQEKLAFSAEHQSFLGSTVSLKDFTDLEKEFNTLKTQFDENKSGLSKFRNMEHLLTEKNEQVKSLEFLTKQMMQEKEQLEHKLDELQTQMLDKIDHKDKEQDVYVESSNSMKQNLMEIEGTEQKDELEQKKTEGISQETDIFRDGLPKPQVKHVAIQTIDSDEEINSWRGEQSLLEISAEHKNEEEEQLKHQAKQIALQPEVSHEEAISESTLSELIIEHESLKLKYEELESEKNLIQKLNRQLQEEKDDIKTDFEMQIAVVENLQHLLKGNQMTINQLHAQDEDLNTKLKVLKADNDELKVEMESLQGQCEGLKQIVASAQMSEMDAKHLLSELHNQLEKIQNENTSLHEEINELQESSFDKVQQFVDRVEEPLVREVLHQTSSIEPSKVENSLLEEHEKLKNKLHINEVKCEKMLYKLKAFKDKNDKLTTEVENLKKSKDHVDNGVYDKSVLETSLEKCKSDLKNSTSSCHSFREENNSLKQMVASLKEQIQTLQNELETKVKEEEMVKSRNEQKIVSLSVENENLKELIKVQDISLESTTDKYHIADRNIKDLHVQLEAFTFREESLNHKLDEQTRLADDLSEKLRRTEGELAFLRPVQTELSEIKAHHDQSLSDLNENFSIESSSLKNNLACLQEQYNMLEADNQEFLILSDNLRETVQNLKKDNEEKSYILSKRDEEISTKQSELSALSAQLTIIERVRDDLLEEKESLKSELLQWNTKDDKETKTIQELERVLGDNEDMKAKMVELESERDELVEEMEGLREDMIKAKGDKIATKNEFKKYEAQIDILKTDNQTLKEQIDGLAWKLEEASGYEEELELIRQQLDSLEVEKVARQSSCKEENNVKVNKLEVTHSLAESEVEEKKPDAELQVSNDKLSMQGIVDEEKLKLTEEITECKVIIEKQKRQLNELNFRLQTLDDLEVEFSELNEQYNKALNDKNDMAKQIQGLHDKLQKLNNVEKEISLIVEQKDHFAREKETLQQRINDLESQGKTVLDENAKLNQELTMLKTSLQQMTFDSNTLKSQLHVASSNGDQKSQFQSEYDNLQKQFNKAIEQKNKSVEDLNEAHYDNRRLEQRCQQLAMQVSQLAGDRSYLNAQLGLLSKSLREKENDWSNMKNQYRSLYQTHMMTQMKMADLEKRMISETFQKAHGSSTKSSVLGHVIPDPSLVEKYKQKLQISERFAEESVQTLKELQAKLEKEEKRSSEIEKMLRDTQDELLLHATKPLREVRLQLEEDESDSRIREYNAFLTRRGMGYCRRLQRWMKVKNRQLTRIMKFRPSIRKCLWAYFILIHVLMVACFTGFL